VPDAFSSAVSESLLDEYAQIMWDFHPVGFRAMSRNVAGDFSDVLPSIDVPTLLIWGDEDKRSPLGCAEDMRKKIPGSRLIVIPGAGHVSNFEKPDEFNAAVREFLTPLATAHTPPE
jgi:pimeloyl-ACP methyl ester carboxylesterase